MVDHVNIKVKLKLETVNRMDEIISYCRFRKEYTKDELPETYEDIVKAAIYFYLNKIETIHSYVVDEKVHKLKSKMKLKNRIKELAEKKGLKQKDIANLTSIDPGNINVIWSNKNQPNADYLTRIWVVLGCPPLEDMFYRTDS